MPLAQRIAITVGLATFLLGMFVAVMGTSWAMLHFSAPSAMLMAGEMNGGRPVSGSAYHIEAFPFISWSLVILGLITASGGLCWSLRK